MSEQNRPDEQPEIPAGGIPLGKLGPDDVDRSLTGGPTAGAAPADDAALALPRGALVAFRKSGGMRFSSRGFVVYRTGWVVPLAGTAGRQRHMTDPALMALTGLLLRSRLTRDSHRKAKATPDGYAYEIVALVGGRLRQVEYQDGAIPAAARRLIDLLQRLMPREG